MFRIRIVPLPAYLKEQNDRVLLHVKVQPRASRTEIAGVLGGELKIKVTAPPVDSAANEALVKFVAELLECPRRAVEIIRGETSRHKAVAVRGVSSEIVQHKISAVLRG